VELDDEIKQVDRAQFARTIEDLRSQIKVDGIGNQLFSISYDGIEPERARRVVQSLLTIFIESNLGQSRTDMQTARDFVDQQIARYEQQLREADQKLAQFRLKHSGIAGEQAYSDRIIAARRELDDATIDLESAKQVRKVLEARLSSTQAVMGDDTPPPQIIVGDQMVVTAIDRINTLRAQLQGLRLQYTDNHPDVIASRDALEALIRQYAGDGERQYAAKPRASQSSDVVSAAISASKPGAALANPGGNGLEPSIVGEAAVKHGSGGALARTEPSGITNLAQRSGPQAAGVNQLSQAMSPNPEYGEIQVQLLKTKFAILEAEQKSARAKAILETLQSGANLAPDVEAEFADLTRGYEVMKKNYQQLLSVRESARMSQDVDSSVDVVQFRVVEPPSLPAKPSGPNRSIFLVMGTFLAFAAGGFGAFARGIFHDAVISAQDLHGSFGLPVIATLGSSGGVFGHVRYSVQWVSLIISLMGIAVTMFMIGYFSPYLEPFRQTIYQIINESLHLWS
jgi:uncharacterized protein involved in exopolysaccharide biosynthesis